MDGSDGAEERYLYCVNKSLPAKLYTELRKCIKIVSELCGINKIYGVSNLEVERQNMFH